jgi:hypothetical protein
METVIRVAWALSVEGELVDLFTNPRTLPSDLAESIRAHLLENQDPRGLTCPLWSTKSRHVIAPLRHRAAR